VEEGAEQLSGLDIEFRKVMDRYYMENPPLDGRIASHYLLLSRCDRLDEFSMDFIARKVFDIEQSLEQAEARVAGLEKLSEDLHESWRKVNRAKEKAEARVKRLELELDDNKDALAILVNLVPQKYLDEAMKIKFTKKKEQS